MFSLVHQKQTLTVAFLVLAAVAAPAPGFSESALGAAADQQRQIVERIEQEQSRNGPYSEELMGPLSALALFFQESGDPGLATATIERLLQVVRANYGLYSLAQAPLIRQLIANEEAIGNAETAWNLEQELLTLARRNPDDLRTVSIFRQIGDKRLDRLEAMKNWAEAIMVFHRNELYSSTELQELERKLIRYGDCDTARQSYRRLIAYDAANSEPWLNRVTTLVEATDSDFVCERTQSAHRGPILETYQQAYELLKRKGVAQASIDRIFSPEAPVMLTTSLPAMAYPMVSAAEPSTSTGYIDVAFQVTKYGRARKVEIRDATTNTTDAVKERVVNWIERGLFRPRATNGKIADTSTLVWRYYW